MKNKGVFGIIFDVLWNFEKNMGKLFNWLEGLVNSKMNNYFIEPIKKLTGFGTRLQEYPHIPDIEMQYKGFKRECEATKPDNISECITNKLKELKVSPVEIHMLTEITADTKDNEGPDDMTADTTQTTLSTAKGNFDTINEKIAKNLGSKFNLDIITAGSPEESVKKLVVSLTDISGGKLENKTAWGNFLTFTNNQNINKIEGKIKEKFRKTNNKHDCEKVLQGYRHSIMLLFVHKYRIDNRQRDVDKKNIPILVNWFEDSSIRQKIFLDDFNSEINQLNSHWGKYDDFSSLINGNEYSQNGASILNNNIPLSLSNTDAFVKGQNLANPWTAGLEMNDILLRDKHKFDYMDSSNLPFFVTDRINKIDNDPSNMRDKITGGILNRSGQGQISADQLKITVNNENENRERFVKSIKDVLSNLQGKYIKKSWFSESITNEILKPSFEINGCGDYSNFVSYIERVGTTSKCSNNFLEAYKKFLVDQKNESPSNTILIKEQIELIMQIENKIDLEYKRRKTVHKDYKNLGVKSLDEQNDVINWE